MAHGHGEADRKRQSARARLLSLSKAPLARSNLQQSPPLHCQTTLLV